MKVIRCNSQEEWESAVTQFPEANFLQSWIWGEFQLSLNKSVQRVLFREDSGLVAMAQVVVERARRGTYLAIAGGPLLVNWKDTRLVVGVYTHLKLLGRELGCSFIRFRPQSTRDQVTQQILDSVSARLSPMHLTADLTIQIDLHQSENELLGAMRKQHRQAIKKADALGITVEISNNPEDIVPFYQEQVTLAKRQGFIPFSKDYLANQFTIFAQADQAALFHAKKGQTLLASAFVIFYNGEAVYHYGVSTEANRNLPGSYACQWAIIRNAKQRGCARYNLWGVSPKEATEHRFSGVSLFKRGFGGREVDYLPAHDIVLSQGYWLTWIFEQFRKKSRRL